jgi:acetyl esterase/lipase
MERAEAEGAATGGTGAHDDLGSVVRHRPNGVMSGSAVGRERWRIAGKSTLATWGNYRLLVSSHRPMYMYAAPQRPESRPISVYLHGRYRKTCAQTSAHPVCTRILADSGRLLGTWPVRRVLDGF